MAKKDDMIIVRIEKEIREKLQELAVKEDRPLSSLIRVLLKKVASGEIKF
jgi:hypothetical protein